MRDAPSPGKSHDRQLSSPVTNGAIVIHTQRLKSDPGGNLLS
ncbi:chemotaxis protein [Escherichia coli]|nr:chemotaxis protein [Escherichia coli]